MKLQLLLALTLMTLPLENSRFAESERERSHRPTGVADQLRRNIAVFNAQ
ncbi:MAG: hypothetical protein RLY93_06280 [Sumerlaeia bacterium]